MKNGWNTKIIFMKVYRPYKVCNLTIPLDVHD